MSRIRFSLAARCDKAGRSENQDNYWVCPDLSRVNVSIDNMPDADEVVDLSDLGSLLVVADGMGGMNAGDKASELVIAGIRKAFSNIPPSALESDDEAHAFIYQAIDDADRSVKDYAREHPETEGMGSTIALLWLRGEKAYCAWCGDSRIYRYNLKSGMVRLSHDHSFVQLLVDRGNVSETEAFGHPNSNIVTRALGDNDEAANPEQRTYDVFRNDVFLLCSDGLSGLLRDEEIATEIFYNSRSMSAVLRSLWTVCENRGFTDNCTIDLAGIVEGGKEPPRQPQGYPVVARLGV